MGKKTSSPVATASYAQKGITIGIYNASSAGRIPRKRMEYAIRTALRGEKVKKAAIDVIVLDNPDIHAMNKQFLRHDYPTDVITFPLEEDKVIGEIYIGYGVAKQQADEYGVSCTNELMRLAVHGTLHLVGYDDATDAERTRMNDLETTYISAS